MKESILDVLLYLFEHYLYDDPDAVQHERHRRTAMRHGCRSDDAHAVDGRKPLTDGCSGRNFSGYFGFRSHGIVPA
mgnify:CR=1 FL=1